MHHHWLTWEELNSHFPTDGEFAKGMYPQQEKGLRFISEKGSSILEIEPGRGKSAIEVTLARVAKKHFQRAVLVTPTKTVLTQINNRFPNDFTIALGRNDFPCFRFEKNKEGLNRESKTKFTADEIPHAVCRTCPHYVDQETGRVQEEGTLACPVYKQNFEVKISRKPILATLAYYVFKRLFSKNFEEPDLLVIDEAHKFAETVRGALSYDISDWHLERAVEVLESVEEHESASALDHFRDRMIKIIKKKPAYRGTLLDSKEIMELVDILENIDGEKLQRSVARAIREDILDVEDNMEVFKKVESVVLNLRRYIRSLELSLPLQNRGALAFTYAYHVEEKGKNEKVQHKLVVCSHYIAALVRKNLLGKTTVALSATIGDPQIFGQESGIQFPFLSIPPSFPAERTRIYMPNDTPNLAFNARKKGSVTNIMRRVARHTKKLADRNLRSLHIVVSNEERQKLLELMSEEGVRPISYGEGLSPRQAALLFKEGEGDALVGTAANFGEGVDLPRQIAPVIFVLRPAYPPPDDPRTQFEERRYGNGRWAVWNWRVMLSILQVRGRNIRSEKDLGVTIFISQQFRRVVFASLPESLRESYKGELSLDECVEEAIKLVA